MGHCLDAVFAKLGDGPLPVRIRPATARAIKPFLLIDLEERLASAEQAHLVRGVFERSQDGGNAAGPGGGRVDFKRVGIVVRDFPRGLGLPFGFVVRWFFVFVAHRCPLPVRLRRDEFVRGRGRC